MPFDARTRPFGRGVVPPCSTLGALGFAALVVVLALLAR
jgi:hypothetical protein